MRSLPLAACLIMMVACASAVAQSPLEKVTAATADVRVTRFDTAVSIRVGQTLGIQPPAENAEWQVDYDAESLRLVTPLTELATPGTRGWVWQATKPGESELVLTLHVKCKAPPCDQNLMKFTVPIEVKK